MRRENVRLAVFVDIHANRSWGRSLGVEAATPRSSADLCHSVDRSAAKQAGDNSAAFLRQLMMRCPPGRSPLHSSSTSTLHSRAIFTGSVKRFLAKAF